MKDRGADIDLLSHIKKMLDSYGACSEASAVNCVEDNDVDTFEAFMLRRSLDLNGAMIAYADWKRL